MSDHDQFVAHGAEVAREMSSDPNVKALTQSWMEAVTKYDYSYHFQWMGRPVIQFPQDIFALQEIIWKVKPDLIIETGIARGGSLVFSASMLALLDLFEVTKSQSLPEGNTPRRKVIGIEVDLRKHNREALDKHQLAPWMEIIEGSSTDPEVVKEVLHHAKDAQTVMVMLDSNHTHSHVIQELDAYSDLVSPGSYVVVFDSIVEDMPDDFYPDRPWGRGNSPKSAIREFLERNDGFESDTSIEDKLLITVCAGGFLRRIS